MSAGPTVSVVLPTLGRAAPLAEAARAILGGTFTDLELIIVDDGTAADAVAELARADARVRLLAHAGGTPDAARDAGARAATGTYVAFADAGDVALPDRLSRQVALLDARPDVVAVGGAIEVVDPATASTTGTAPNTNTGTNTNTADTPAVAHDVLTGAEQLARALPHRNPIFTHTVTFRRDAFEAVGGTRAAFEVGGDYDLWLRLLDRGHAFDNVAEPVARFGPRSETITGEHLAARATATLVAQFAARARREMGQDPIEDGPVDAQLLARLGVVPERLLRAEITEALWWADLLTDAGRFDAALALLEHVAERSDAAKTPRSLLARIHRAYAKIYNRQNRRVRQLTAVARAEWLERDFSPATVVWRVARKVSRATRGRLKRRDAGGKKPTEATDAPADPPARPAPPPHPDAVPPPDPRPNLESP